MSFKSPIIVHNTIFPNGTTLKDKVESKFNVLITDTAFEPTLKEMINPSVLTPENQSLCFSEITG